MGKLLQKDPHGKNLSSNDKLCEDDMRLPDTFMILSFSLAYIPFKGATWFDREASLKSIDRAEKTLIGSAATEHSATVRFVVGQK